MLKKVIIASKNPVKINATKLGFQEMFPQKKFDFQAVAISSDVNDQPLSDQETIKGANERADKAQKEFPEADFWVGIEGGVEKVATEMEAFAWIVVKSRSISGKAKTVTFFLPAKIIELIESGKELGEADDIVFGGTNSKQKNGGIGFLTQNVRTRTSYYVEAVVSALIPFKNPKLY